MKFDCPHCAQNLELSDEWARHSMDCPSCAQPFIVPAVTIPVRSSVPPRPPMARRPASGNYTPSKPPRRDGGGGKFLLFVIMLVAGVFGYAMVHFNESPQQVWKRITDIPRNLTRPPVFAPSPTPAPTPVATPMPAPTATPQPTPEAAGTPVPEATPDAVSFLIQNPAALPREVMLSVPAQFYVMVNGTASGLIDAKPGALLVVTGIEAGYLTVSLGSASRRLPIASTDLAARAPDAMRFFLNRLDARARLEALSKMQTPAATTSLQRSATSAGPRFVHPGIPLTKEDLAELKRNIGHEPWKSGFEQLKNDWRSKLDYKMRGPYEKVTRNPHSRRHEWMTDMQAAWNLARMWIFTGDTAYAKKSRDILIAWATTQKEFSGMEANLDLGDYAFRWGGAVSILRGTWPGWTEADTVTMKHLFGEVYWPSTGGWRKMPGPTNKGSLSLAAATAIAVFCDDNEKLQYVLELLRTAPSTGFANTLPIGEHGESGRDQGHSYAHLLAMSFTAEVLWKQGIDVFSERDNRLLAMGEYYSRLNVQVPTPFIPMGTTDEYYHGIWDKPGFAAEPMALSILRSAYVVRKGMGAPYLEQKLDSQGTNMESFMFYKTRDDSQAAPLPPVVFPEVSPVGTGGLKSVNIGATPDGRTDYADGMWTVTGGGQDIWGHQAGSCRFVYKRVKGDCALVARVDSFGQGGQPNAKAGVMIRSDLAPNPAASAWIALTAGGKLESFFHGWAEMYGGANWEAQGYDNPPPPYWVKVERRGDVVTTYASPDGVSWATIIASTYSNLGDSPYIGLVVCAFSKTTPLTATFSRVSVTGGGGGKVFVPAAPLAIYASPGNNQVPLRWLESFGAESYNVKRSTTKGGPYRTIASVKGTSHVDAAASNGETYYYVVSAVNAAGEGPDSPEDPVKPASK